MLTQHAIASTNASNGACGTPDRDRAESGRAIKRMDAAFRFFKKDTFQALMDLGFAMHRNRIPGEIMMENGF